MNNKKIYILILSFFSLPVFANPLFPKTEISQIGKKISSSFISFNPPSSAKELGIGSTQVTLYPNPTQGSFTVEIEFEKSTDIDITIYNAIGKIVDTKMIYGSQGPTHKVSIPFDDHPAGVYFVHVKAGPIKSVERLIKIK
jgi:hypothetical protein